MSNVTSRIIAVLVAATVVGAASARADQVNPREFQAFGHHFQAQATDHGHWRKANGAEILGGFAGPDDEVNDQTGEVRSR